MVDKIRSAVTGSRVGSLSRKRLALLGLTFEAGTNDLRDSPALAVAALLRQAGAELVAYDPALAAADAARLDGLLSVVDSPLGAVEDADAVVVLTDWPEFRGLDWVKMADAMRRPVVVDTRNLIDRDVLSRAGLHGHSLGRPSVAAAVPQPDVGS